MIRVTFERDDAHRRARVLTEDGEESKRLGVYLGESISARCIINCPRNWPEESFRTSRHLNKHALDAP